MKKNILLHSAQHRCPETKFKCKKSGQCIEKEKVCDYVKDCLDGSDEDECRK